MIKLTNAFLSGLVFLSFILIGIASAKEATLAEQETVLETELAQATTHQDVVKINLALAQVRKLQSAQEFKKFPEMVGRDRSFLSSSVKESYTYRQMASSFQKEPGKSSIANSYYMGQFLSICCVMMALIGLCARAKYRY